MTLPQLDWSDWIPLNSFEETGDPRLQKTGVYQVRIVRDGEPVTIPRWLGEDGAGLIYIGCTGDRISARLRKFRDGIDDHGKRHSAGMKRYLLQRWVPAYRERFGGLVRECRWAETEEGMARQMERDLLLPYVQEYGETPPLNGAFAYRREPDVWEGRFATK